MRGRHPGDRLDERSRQGTFLNTGAGDSRYIRQDYVVPLVRQIDGSELRVANGYETVATLSASRDELMACGIAFFVPGDPDGRPLIEAGPVEAAYVEADSGEQALLILAVADYGDPLPALVQVRAPVLAATNPAEFAAAIVTALGLPAKRTTWAIPPEEWQEWQQRYAVSLEHGDGEVRTIFDGRGPQHEPEAEHLSRIIEVINERFGLKLTEADQILFDQFEQAWVEDKTLASQAKENDLANFRFAFDKTFMNTIVSRMDANSDIFKRVLDDADFRSLLADYYVKKVYEELRKAA